MAFFTKLKERLFKSSNRIDKGLDALIEEAPAQAEAPAIPEAPAPSPEFAPRPEPAPIPEPARAPAPRAEEPAPRPAPAPETRPGLVGRLLGQERTRVLDDAMLESLELA